VDYEKIKSNPVDTEIPETILIFENMQLGGKNLSKINEEYPEELRLKKRSPEKTKQELEKIDKHNLLVGYKRILDAKDVFVTLFEALQYLHEKKGMHRDLKPESKSYCVNYCEDFIDHH
jgi:serine/threonine protein kinase